MKTKYDSHPMKKIRSPAQLARDLGISSEWICDEVQAGRLPHIKASEVILLNREAVEAALLERAAQRQEDGGGDAQ